MNHQPLVTCIMPTANRQQFVSLAVESFLNQDYLNTELVIIDDGIESCADLIPDSIKIRYFYSAPLGTIGVKRNIACQKAKGEFIMHWDDDDLYAPDWISRQVKSLESSKADITGLNKVMLQSFNSGQRYIYEDLTTITPWLCGATLAYKKALWQNYPFIDLQIGEDNDFLANSGGMIIAHHYVEGFVAGLHADNTSIKYVEKYSSIKWAD